MEEAREMWEAIGSVLTNRDGVAGVILILLVVVIAVALLGRRGLIAVHTRNFSLGGANIEREIIRHQIEVAHGSVLAAGEELGFDDDYHAKYVLERVYDKVVEWIVFNHISDTPIYVESKRAAIYNLILSLNPPIDVRGEEMKKRIREWVKNIVVQLVQTREYYSVKGR